MKRILGFARQRNFLVMLNTAIAAGTSVILLLGAARSMDSLELSNFSLVQLIIMTAVMLQRALFLSPALASQRHHGRSLIPARWGVQLSVPCAAVLGLILSAIMSSQVSSSSQWFLLSMSTAAVVLVQDTLRFSLMSRDRILGAVVSDSVWLALIGLTIFLGEYLSTAFSLTIYWLISGLGAVTVALLFLWFGGRQQSLPRVITLKQTWRLGKWSGLDAFMSATANLAPMLMTALVIGSEHAGTYRVLQSSLGPLNILSTSLITMLGLDSWKFVSLENLSSLRKTVRRALWYMTAFAMAYIALAELAVTLISGLESPELARIALIVGIVGVIGAATAPLSAAALALGYQRDGAILRLIIVTFSLAASLLGGLGLWLPWNDPIGTVTLFAAVTGFIGWTLSYRRAMRTEQSLSSPAPSGRKGAGRHFAQQSPLNRR
jgi:O-antigen/teichoic acid export membrane protein